MSRRGENIYKRQDGRWEARYIKARDATGRAVYGYIYRHSYLEAKRAQAEAKATCGKQEISGEKQSFRQMTLGEYMRLWQASIQMSVKKSTYANYDGLIRRHIDPVLGQIPLRKIDSNILSTKDAYNLMLKEYPDVLDINQMSAALGVSTKTGYQLLRNGEITCLKVGRSYRIPKAHLLTYLKIGSEVRQAM